jgi:hypothetical protein
MTSRMWQVTGVVLFLNLCGCTTSQLQCNTINQMSTVHDLQQQQVLDNLAMFIENPQAYPYYSMVTQGTAQITDTGTLAVTTGFARTSGQFLFSSLGINPTASRQLMGSWLVNPVNDSIKLTMMRCVYQRAIAGCLGVTPSTCPNCDNLFRAFYGKPPVQPAPSGAGPAFAPPAPSPSVPWPGGEPTASFAPAAAPPTAGGPAAAPLQSPHVDGIVTPYCLDFGYCWFCCGHKLPKNCHCQLVGHYCNTYVWVPDEGRDQLTKLTLLIQDIAFYDPPAPPSSGAPVTPSHAIPYRPPTGRMPSVYPYTSLGEAQLLRAVTPSTVPIPGS